MNLREELHAAYETGRLLDVVYAKLRTASDAEVVASELVVLHNDGSIDVVAAFCALEPSETGPDFFMTRHVFEKSLPQLDAPVIRVLACVAHLYESAGQDMVAGSVVDSYEAFCEKVSGRPGEALAAIEADPAAFARLLPATLIAGSRVDGAAFRGHAIRLSDLGAPETRHQAIFAMGRIDWPPDETSTATAVDLLKRLAETDPDDNALAAVVSSAHSLFSKGLVAEQELVLVIGTALERGDAVTLHSAAGLLASNAADLTDQILDLLIKHLERVDPVNRGTVRVIDSGLWRLLGIGETSRAIRLLETLLLAHPKDLDMEVFGGVSAEIVRDPAFMNRIATRWLLKGDLVLGDAVHEIVSSHVLGDLPLEVDPDELGEADDVHTIFLARKIVGFLFSLPVVAASMLVSLMRHVSEQQTREELGDLLRGTLLLSYTGKVRDFLLQRSDTESAEVGAVLKTALEQLEKYLEGLRSVGELPALHPSILQREAYRRHFEGELDKSWRAAKDKSPLLSLIGESVLLYGRASITYVRGPEGERQREESPLQAHETEMEMPRMEALDPVGLEMMLRIFRAESIAE